MRETGTGKGAKYGKGEAASILIYGRAVLRRILYVDEGLDVE